MYDGWYSFIDVPTQYQLRGYRHLPTLLVLIAALFAVPPLVRAADHLGNVSRTPIRLNRGFESPPTKTSVSPTIEPIVDALVDLETPARVTSERVNSPERLPDSPLDLAPDPLRGPPSLLF